MIITGKIIEYINSKNEKEFEPYYVYNSQTIKDNCQIFNNISYKNKAIHFASMANINPHFLNIIKNEKVNIFVNSVLHLNVALQVGFPGQDIVFTSSALSEKTMKYVVGLGVQLNVDSPNQLKQWFNLFPEKPVGIRCNIGDKVKPYSTHAGFFIGKESRLGFTHGEIRQITDKSKIKTGKYDWAGISVGNRQHITTMHNSFQGIFAN